MNCTVYMVNCNFATHPSCPLALTSYKYNEFQMSFVTQKCNCTNHIVETYHNKRNEEIIIVIVEVKAQNNKNVKPMIFLYHLCCPAGHKMVECPCFVELQKILKDT